VTKLELSLQGLVGTIPNDVGLWTDLTKFFVSGNNLVGSLPSSIVLMTSLTDFDIRNNNLVGTVPKEVSQWTSIQYAFFNGNMLTKTMPAFRNNFCPRNGMRDIGLFPHLWADCGPPNPDIKCDCCNNCF
jgi:hypothetical protein